MQLLCILPYANLTGNLIAIFGFLWFFVIALSFHKCCCEDYLVNLTGFTLCKSCFQNPMPQVIYEIHCTVKMTKLYAFCHACISSNDAKSSFARVVSPKGEISKWTIRLPGQSRCCSTVIF